MGWDFALIKLGENVFKALCSHHESIREYCFFLVTFTITSSIFISFLLVQCVGSLKTPSHIVILKISE